MKISVRWVLVALALLVMSGNLARRSQAQVAQSGRAGTASALLTQSTFSELTAKAAADPADAVCPRSAVNSVVNDPPLLTSQNGVLEVSFQYQTAVDAAGLTRYCYVYTDSSGVSHEAPTLEVNPGDQLIIHFTNSLPAASAADVAAHSMHAMKTQPPASAADAACSATSVTAGSTNLHFHGTNVAPVCHQDEVLHTLVQPQTEFDYSVQIPANEPPGVYWYHPHPHGYSSGQVIGGASGAILVEGIQNVNPAVTGLSQRVFVLRDQDLPATDTAQAGNPLPKTDISINYVPILYPSYTPAVIQTGPSEQEFWRVLNASANTLMDIAVMDNGQPQTIQIVSVDGVPLTDANGNPTTASVTSYAMSPASRIEFIVTTPPLGDATAQLVMETWNNGPIGDADPGRPIANIVSSAGAASSAAIRRLPAQSHAQAMTRFTAIDATTPVTQRTLYFSLNISLNPPQFYITVDGQQPAVFNMDGPPNITVTEGTVEQWTIQNRSQMDHNFHIHQLHFQTLAINGVAVSDTTRRDTIDVPHWSGNASDPYPSVTLLMDFRDPNIVGTFVYHCHILTHEDDGMMGKIQVLPGGTATTLSVSPAASVSAGTNVTLTATVAPAAGSGTPTGTVTFTNRSATLGTGTLNAGVATLALTSLPIAVNTITAAYSGDNSFAASTATGITVTVTPAAATVSLTASPATAVFGGSVALTATVTAPAGTGTPIGNVTFQSGGTVLGTEALNGSGVAALSTTSLPIGSDPLTAVYAGNANFAAATSTPVTVTIQPIPTTTALTVSPTTAVTGGSVLLTANVTAAPGAGTPSGTINFLNGGVVVGNAVLNGSGIATFTATSLPVGTLSITAAYAGNASFASSTSTAVAVTIQPLPPDFGVAANPTTVSIASGGNGTSAVTITPLNGFGSAVTFACSGLPSEAACSFSPATVTPSGTTAVTSTATITTTAASSMAVPTPGPRGGGLAYAWLLPGMGALLGLGALRRRLPTGIRRAGMLTVAFALAVGVGACGSSPSSPSNPGTPAGTSTVTITATSGSIVHTATFTMTVSQ